MEENNQQIETVYEDHEEGSAEVLSGLIVLILIVVAAIVLWNTNPSEADHKIKVKEVVAEVVGEYAGEGKIMIPPKALGKIEYHSLGLFSWTTARHRGKDRIATVGAFNYILPLFEIQ